MIFAAIEPVLAAFFTTQLFMALSAVAIFLNPDMSQAEINPQTETFFTTRHRSWSGSPFVKDNRDHFLYARHEISQTKDDYHWVASPYFLISYSESADQGTDPILTSIFADKRQLDIDKQSDDDRHTAAAFDFQELAFNFHKHDFNFELGRRILSIGNLKLFSVWNKFNPTALSLRPTWINGVDQLKVGWQHEDLKITGYNVFDQESADEAQFLIFEYFKSPVQFNALLGDWWHAKALGFSATADVAGWLLKLETLSLHYYGAEDFRRNELQTAVGIEHAFLQNWTINFEMLHQSEGADTENEYTFTSRSPHQSFRGRRLIATELKWTPDPFYNFTALGALSLVDDSRLLGVIAAHQWSEEIEVSAGIMLPQGEGELGRKMKPLSSTSFVGVPTQVDFTVKAFF